MRTGHAERRGLQSTLMVVVAITCVVYCVAYFMGIITLNRTRAHIATFMWRLPSPPTAGVTGTPRGLVKTPHFQKFFLETYLKRPNPKSFFELFPS